jgi:hypothetical protein
MLKAILTGLLLFAATIFPTFALHPEDGAETVWDFYQRHPRLQDFYPWGLYTIPVAGFIGKDDEFNLQHGLDLLAENAFNAIWQNSHPFNWVNPPSSEEDVLFIRPGWNEPAPRNPVLSDLAKRAFGELYPSREMKTLYSLQPWFRFNWPLFEGFPGNGPFMTDNEFAAIEKKAQGVLDHARRVGETYPDTVMGILSDDEPWFGPGGKAAIDLVEKHTGLFATTVIPDFSSFQQWAPYIQPIGGDWYVTMNMFRKSWAVAERLRWLNEHHPEKIFLFMPLLSKFNYHDITLPGLKNALTSQTELRMQIWQAVALGCKGVYGWSHGEGMEWAAGHSSPLNTLSRPTNKLWDEMRDLGNTIVPVGPLLLSCQSDTTVAVEVSSGRVRYPEFQGPAVDYGLLKDVRGEYDRHYLIPWNNDVDNPQTASFALSSEFLKGRTIYDMIEVKEAVLTENNRLKITLPPGGGHIFLIASPSEYKTCRDTVLRHRVRVPRVLSRIRRDRASAIRGLDLGGADRLIDQAKQVDAAEQWEGAAVLYNKAVDSINKVEEQNDLLVATKQALDRLADTLSQTDALLKGHGDIMKLGDMPLSGRSWKAHLANEYVGEEIGNWTALVEDYWNARKALFRGAIEDPGFSKNVLSLETQAEQNRHAVEERIDRRLKDVRKPIKVALLTPDTNQVEYNNLYTRLYKYTHADWISPDGEGRLVVRHTHADWIHPDGRNPQSDRIGKDFSADYYDVVFVHQIRFVNPPGQGEKIDPAQVLMPQILAEDMQRRIAAFVENGGGLLLSGIAGLYVNRMGIEDIPADRICENGYYPRAFAVGFSPAAGFSRHPIFKGLPAEGFFTNGSSPGENLVTEHAWEKAKPSGVVIANELDDVFGRIDKYAAVVEYHRGEGTIIVFGGRAVDFTPGIAHSLPAGKNQPSELLAPLVSFTINTLDYLASQQRYDAERVSVMETVEKPEKISLPLDGWMFKTDPDSRGMQAGWQKPGFDATGWKSLRVDSPWGPQGHDGYVGSGWYRIHFTAANRPGKRTVLHFAGVDEEAVVFIDGNLAGKHLQGPTGWNKPFSFDITGFLKDVPARCLLAVQATNTAAAGGIWRPVFIVHE